MRRTAIALLAAASLTLAGCSNSSNSKADAKPSPSKTVDPGTQFLKAVHGISHNGNPSDAELLALPPQWCKALDAGHSVKWMFDSSGNGGGLYPWGAEWGTTQADAYTMLVAGVTAYCPRNVDAVKKELRDSGGY